MSKNRLTVVQLLPELNSGGVERGTLEIASALVERGHRSMVISAHGALVEQLTQEGSEHIPWDIGAKRVSTLRWISRLKAFLGETRPDVLHLRSRLPAWVGYLAWKGLAPSARPKLVTTVHGPYTVGYYSSVMMRGERVIAVSQMIRDYILRNYTFVKPNRIRLVYRGVDRSIYRYGYKPDQQWRDDWNKNQPALENKYVLTLPARITRWKGQLDFIGLIEGLRQQGVPVHGLIVGGTHRKKKAYQQLLQSTLQQKALTDHISMLGHRDDLKEILAISDVVLSLSTEAEAFGRTTLEALSMGVPVAGYDHGGVAEQLAAVLPTGKVPMGDIANMLDLLQKWYQQPPTLTRDHPFTLQAMQEATLQVYEELVNPTGA